MSPLDRCSQGNKDLAWKHLEAEKPKTAVSTITSAAQTAFWNLSLWLRTLGKDLKPGDATLDNAPTTGQDMEGIYRDTTPASSNVNPSSREIPKAWKDYSEKWFYSYPFGDDS